MTSSTDNRRQARVPDGAGELLPCPFCGSAEVETHFIRDGRECACRCGASTVEMQPNAEAKVRAAWNRRAASPSPPVLADGGWRPAETAPDDGTEFLVCWRHHPLFAVVKWGELDDEYSGSKEAWIENGRAVGGFTDWMPLPEPPGQEQVSTPPSTPASDDGLVERLLEMADKAARAAALHREMTAELNRTDSEWLLARLDQHVADLRAAAQALRPAVRS